MPGAANPQAYNRYSYVLNNPIRYNDPTGHFCSDPEDLWSPGCDGSGGRPKNTPAPLPDSPVVINNPGPLDDGQEQDDPVPNPNGPFSPTPPCASIMCSPNAGGFPPYTGAQPNNPPNMFFAFSAIGDFAEGGFFASLSIYALVASCSFAGPACLITAPIFFTMAVVGTQVMVNGIQSYRQSQDPSVEPTGREVIDLVFPFLKKK